MSMKTKMQSLIEAANAETGKGDTDLTTAVQSLISESGGTSDHRQLTNRDAENQHPITAITGLQTALDSKANAADIPSLEGYATEAYVQNYHDNTKQDIITDLATIRSGASKGATAVQPEAGKGLFSGSYNDLTDKPAIPDAVTEGTVSGWGFTKNTGTYSKPTGGIPKADLANDVQASLDKAETALQEHQSLAAYRTSADQDVIDGSKQDKLIAGENITIAADGKTISATGGAEALIVTITESNGALSANKSYIEIRDAIFAGIPVLVDYADTALPLITLTADALYFGAVQCDSGDTTNPAVVATLIIKITQNGGVNDISAAVETLPNPHALTFTGAASGTYDGSAPLTVNIPSGGGGSGGGYSDYEVLIDETITTDEAGISTISYTELDFSKYNDIVICFDRALNATNTSGVRKVTIYMLGYGLFYNHTIADPVDSYRSSLFRVLNMGGGNVASFASTANNQHNNPSRLDCCGIFPLNDQYIALYDNGFNLSFNEAYIGTIKLKILAK